MEQQAREEKEFDTLIRKDKALLAPKRGVPNHIDISTKVTVHEKALQGDSKDRTPTSVNK